MPIKKRPRLTQPARRRQLGTGKPAAAPKKAGTKTRVYRGVTTHTP